MKKTAFKIILDIVMTILFLTTMAYTLTGGYIHELIGLIVLGLFVFHNLLNIKWIGNVTKKVFSGKNDGLSSVKYIVDILLLILFVAAGGSGILISNSFFTSVSTDNRPLWVYIHNISSYSALVVLSVHIGLHWSFIMAAFRRMFHYENDCTPRKVVLRVCAFALAVIGIKANIDKDFTEHFVYENDTISSQQDKLSESTTVETYTESTAIKSIETVDYTSTLALEFTRGHGTASFDFSSNPPSANESLDDYLGRLHCTGCGKQCLLTNPQCNTGMTLSSQGEEYYNSYSAYIEDDTQQDDTQTDSSISNETAPDSDVPSLDEYLGKLNCTGCSKRCLLTSPRCGVGVGQAENASNDYNELYGSQTVEEDESTTDLQTESKTDENSSASDNNSSESSIPSLDEYLGKLHCTGCGRQCLLTNPQCSKGVSQAETATQEYNELYSAQTQQTQELVFEDDKLGSLKSIFTTMIPVMALYVAGTHYIVKFTRKKGKGK